MRLSELTAYAEETYRIREQRKWADWPGFSVLVDPVTGKWAALLMRQWDGETGREVERCDLRCGRDCLTEFPRPWLSAPFRMEGTKWVGLIFDERTEPELVFRLLDRALASFGHTGFTLVLRGAQAPGGSPYGETPLPRRPGGEDAVPARIREMRKLWVYGDGSFRQTCRNFCAQARFMEDYTDDLPWRGSFLQYFPTYRDLNTEQLRGYFTWRSAVRRGEYSSVPTSLAYLYIYELLNGIGASDPEDSLRKLEAFGQGYVDGGYGEAGIRANLRRWMLELAVRKGVAPEIARQYADPAVLRQDEALAVLRSPEEASDEALFDALCAMSRRDLASCAPVEQKPAEAKALFARVWRRAARDCRVEGKTLFTACFGSRRAYRWHPLGNAVYWDQDRPGTEEYTLDPCRSYVYKAGSWQEKCYRKLHFDKARLDGLLHETERALRAYLRAGRPLKARPEEAWAAPYVQAVIEEDRQEKLAAARPRVRIDFSGLEQIRRDAVITRDRLLTPEELAEPAQVPPPVPGEMPSAPEGPAPLPEEDSLPLTGEQKQLLELLLAGGSARSWLEERREMPSVAADDLNEALFDLVGDSVVDWDGEELTLVEDYREELIRMLGGNGK